MIQGWLWVFVVMSLIVIVVMALSLKKDVLRTVSKTQNDIWFLLENTSADNKTINLFGIDRDLQVVPNNIDYADFDTETVSTLDGPDPIIYAPSSKNIYVIPANQSGFEEPILQAFDPTDNSLIKNFFLDGDSTAAFDQKIGYSSASKNIYFGLSINGASRYAFVDVDPDSSNFHNFTIGDNVIIFGSFIRPTASVYAVNNKSIYLIEFSEIKVLDTDPNSSNFHTITTTISAGDNYRDGVYASNENKVFAVDRQNDNVRIIDTTDNSHTTLAVGTDPVAVDYTPNTSKIYVSNETSNNVTVIDATTDSVITTVNVGTSPQDVAFSDINDNVYVVNNGSDDVTIIDAQTDSVINASLSVGSNPVRGFYSQSNDGIYILNSGGNTVSVINPNTNNVDQTINVGTNPQEIAEAENIKELYVTNQDSDTLTNIKPNLATSVRISTGNKNNVVSEDSIKQVFEEIKYMPIKPCVFKVDTFGSISQLKNPFNYDKRTSRGGITKSTGNLIDKLSPLRPQTMVFFSDEDLGEKVILDGRNTITFTLEANTTMFLQISYWQIEPRTIDASDRIVNE